MKLVTFEVKTDIGNFQRVGALLGEEIVDLNLAYASYLYTKERENRAYELAVARFPSDMVEILRGGESCYREARKALAYIGELTLGEHIVTAPKGEHIIYQQNEVKLLTPVPRPNSIRDSWSFEQQSKMSARGVRCQTPGTRFRPITGATPIW
jgi:hypothetical protein